MKYPIGVQDFEASEQMVMSMWTKPTREREYRGRDDSSTDAQSLNGYLYQAESGQAFSALRLCGSQYGQQLRYHLSDGWRLYPHLQFGEEHGGKPHRHDLRRCQAKLCPEDFFGCEHRPSFISSFDGRQVRDICRGYRG